MNFSAKQLETGDVILPTLLDEFPFLHVSPHTLETMRRKQTQQLTSLSKSAQSDKRQTKTQKVIEDAEKRQQTLLKILRKDLQHNQRMVGLIKMLIFLIKMLYFRYKTCCQKFNN